MIPRLRCIGCVAAVVVAACVTPPPRSALLEPLGANDWRRALVGTWNVEFRLDSTRKTGGAVALWQAASFRSTSGTLRLADTVTAQWEPGLQSDLDVRFDDLLGRPMTCFNPRQRATGVDRRRGEIILRFTPGAHDCGFAARGRLRGDSLVGTWQEDGFAGSPAMGRFRMTRVRLGSAPRSADSLVAAIESALPRFRVDSGEVFGMSTEGALVVVHYEGDQLRRVMAEFLGEMGRATEVYYFDSDLFLVMRTEVTYTAPFGPAKDSSVSRFDLLRDTSRVLRDSLNAEARALLDALKAR